LPITRPSLSFIEGIMMQRPDKENGPSGRDAVFNIVEKTIGRHK